MTNLLTRIKLTIVDDHKLVRKGLISLLDMFYKEFYEVASEAVSGDEFIGQFDAANPPDIVIMDIEMPPGRDGYETVAWLATHYPDVKVLVVSQVDKEESIIKMLKLGVKGYLGKDVEPSELHSALQAIHDKGYYYTDFITGKLIHNLTKGGIGIDAGHVSSEVAKDLSDIEMQFLKLSCSELTYEQVAEKMIKSPKTIDGYRNKLFEKFGVTSRVGLVIYAIRNGLVKI
jgi:two-component system, NarL family, invasion response regulator UvrY